MVVSGHYRPNYAAPPNYPGAPPMQINVAMAAAAAAQQQQGQPPLKPAGDYHVQQFTQQSQHHPPGPATPHYRIVQNSKYQKPKKKPI